MSTLARAATVEARSSERVIRPHEARPRPWISAVASLKHLTLSPESMPRPQRTTRGSNERTTLPD